MPKLKQPVSLQKVSMCVLLEFVLNYCDQLSVKGSLAELRRGVSIIKKHVCNDVPWYLLADFCTGFLEKFYAVERPASHHKAATEILVDIEIVGLRCNDQILGYLDPNDVHRVRRLQELDLGNIPTTISLDKLHLDDLVTFEFANKCTDLNLEVIGRNCPKLQVLKVPSSRVTDKGVHALSQCSELRVVDIRGCLVSLSDANDLLLVHKKIEEFTHSYFYLDCDVIPQWNSTVCPSMNRYHFDQYRDDDRVIHLQSIVARFPNLIYLKMYLLTSLDLSTLKSLNQLTGIEIAFCVDMYYDEIKDTWENLKTLLSFIGANITTLKLNCWDQGYMWDQDSVNFIFKSCPNIEYLGFDKGPGLVVIPPFQKLKELVPEIPINCREIENLDDPALEFSPLPNLETLWVLNYGMNLQTIESMMLDDIKFPKLSVIETNYMRPEDVEHIECTARNHNLDFKIKNELKYNWYMESRFTDNRHNLTMMPMMWNDIFENQLTNARI